MRTGFERLDRHGVASAIRGGDDATANSEHEEARRKVDLAHDLIQMGQLTKPKAELADLLDGDPLPSEIEFRVFTNLGACALTEGDDDEACSHFERAYQIQPDNPKAISNAAMALLLQGNLDSAVKLAYRALELNPKDGHTAAVIIESLFEAGEEEKFRLFVDSHPWVMNDRQSGLVLADIRTKQSRFEEAALLCRNCVRDEPEDFGGHLMLSRCLIAEAQASFLLSGADVEAAYTRLQEAECAASEAIRLLEYTERKIQLSEALISRAFIQGLRARYEEAFDDLTMARRATPTNPSIDQLRGLLLMSAGRSEEARDAFLAVRELDPSMDVTAPLAESYLRCGNPAAAATLVRDRFSFVRPGPDDLWKAELVCRGELASGEADPCWASFEAAIEDRPDDPWLLTISAIRSRMAGDFETAEQLFQWAGSLTTGGEQAVIKSRLGSLYQQWNRFSEAADVYEEMAGGSGKHPVAVDLLICLVNAKRLRKALSWAQRIHSAGQDVPKVVLDAEAQILEIAGDLRAATSLREEICDRDDATALDRVGLANAQFRAGEKEDAAETANSIDSMEVATDTLLLIRLAKLKRVLQLPGWLQDAYLARRFGGDNPETHVVYFGMFVMQQGDFFEPEIVESGHAVQLRNTRTDERKWWLILEDGEEPQGPNELRRTSEPAQLLIGRRVGEAVPFRSGIEELDYEVLTVQSKYVRAFQETADEFSTRFPDHPGLHRVDAADGDFTKLFVMAERDHEHTRGVIEAYRSVQVPLPFAMFASLLHRPALEVWAACSSDGEIPIRFASGDYATLQRAIEALSEAEGIVLDLLALTTVFKLGLGEQLCRHFSVIAIPQWVIDELRDTHQLAYSLPPHGRFGKADNGQYFFTDQSEADTVAWKGFTGKLLEFAEPFEPIPSYGVLEVDDSESMVEALTASAVATIYVDDNLNGMSLVLVSDDQGLATIAGATGKQVANSQALLRVLLLADQISPDEYSAAVEQLAVMHYSFVQVEADDIVRRLRLTNYRSTEGVRSMLRCLRGPECTQESAVRVAALVVECLAGSAPMHNLELILDLLMTEIQRGRDSQQVLQQLAQVISASSKLMLMPGIQEVILSSIGLHSQFAPPGWRVGAA